LKAKDLIFWGYFASMLSLSVTWSFRNNFSRHISYYQCRKHLCCL